MSQQFDGLSFTYGVPEYGCNPFTRSMAERMASDMKRTGIPSSLLGSKQASFIRVLDVRFENWSADGSVGKAFIEVDKSGPMFLDDEEMMNAQREAQLAGLELAKQNPGAKPGDNPNGEEEPQDNEEEDSQQETPSQGTKGGTVSKKPDKGKGVGKASTDDGKTAAKGERSVDDSTLTRILAQVEELLARLPESTSMAQSESTEQGIQQDYRRWRQRALDDVGKGRAQRGFTSTLIPEHIHAFIVGELAQCHTPDEVKAVFERARAETVVA